MMKILPTINTVIKQRDNKPAFGSTVHDCGGIIPAQEEIKYFERLKTAVMQGVFSTNLGKTMGSHSVSSGDGARLLIINDDAIMYFNRIPDSQDFGTWSTRIENSGPLPVKKIISEIRQELDIDKFEREKPKILQFSKYRK